MLTIFTLLPIINFDKGFLSGLLLDFFLFLVHINIVKII
jgi:hypothetical protein